MTPIEKLIPAIIKALLSECNFSGELVWNPNQEWLASLVVGIVEKESEINMVWPDMRLMGNPDAAERKALHKFSITQADYAEIKRRVER